MSDGEKEPAPTGGAPGEGQRQDLSDASQSERLRLLGEELSVGVEQVETGRVRVGVSTREHEEHVQVDLAREAVEVKRVSINEPVDAIPAPRRDGETTIFSLVEERLVLTKVLFLTEELHVRRTRTVEQHEESVVLRRQEASVTRLPPDPSHGSLEKS